jgi:hypothetical protein
MTAIGAVRLNCPDCGFDETLIEQPWARCTCMPEQGNTWRLHGDHYDPVRVEAVFQPPPGWPLHTTGSHEFKADLGKIKFDPKVMLPDQDPLTANALRKIMVGLGLLKPTWRERLAVRIANIAVWLCRKIDPS